jgi:hypothetical protein
MLISRRQNLPHEQYFEQGIGRKGVFKFGHFAGRRIAELYRIGSHAAMVRIARLFHTAAQREE